LDLKDQISFKLNTASSDETRASVHAITVNDVSLCRISISSESSYENLIHRSLVRWLDCSAVRHHGRIATNEVVRHLLVQFFCRLLGDAGRLSSASSTGLAAAGILFTRGRLTSLAIGSRLRLRVARAFRLATSVLVSRQKSHSIDDLRHALGQLFRLRKGRYLLRSDDDLDLKDMSI
jgi:hypothetical protein